MQENYEVADVLRAAPNYEQCLGRSIHQSKTLRALQQCRTAALGGHIDACDGCGNISISYNSCRNRHCPKCQGHKREEWIQRREADLLPCAYYHVVFTLPQELNALALHQPTLVYDTLFKSVWQTLNQFGNTAGVQLGMIAVLHTWGQNLSLHPHLHCIVPGGGVNAKGKWQKQPKEQQIFVCSKSFKQSVPGKICSIFKRKWNSRQSTHRNFVCKRLGGVR